MSPLPISKAGASRVPEFVLDQIPTEQVLVTWPHMREFFQRACDRVPSQFTPDLILHRALTGQADLWAIYDKAKPLPLLAAASTATRGKLIVIEELGGNGMNQWKGEMLARFESLARAKGIATVEVSGRFGWQRLLPDYTPVRIAMRKAL